MLSSYVVFLLRMSGSAAAGTTTPAPVAATLPEIAASMVVITPTAPGSELKGQGVGAKVVFGELKAGAVAGLTADVPVAIKVFDKPDFTTFFEQEKKLLHVVAPRSS